MHEGDRNLVHTEFLVITVLCVCRSVIETGKRFPVLFLQGGKHLFLIHHKNGTMYAGSIMVSWSFAKSLVYTR